jgi:hypothetical protein
VGQFVFGYVEQTPVVAMQGRVHLYEGYDARDVVLPTRLMAALGAEILFFNQCLRRHSARFGRGVADAADRPDLLLRANPCEARTSTGWASGSRT